MTFGARKDGLAQCSETESHAILDRFVELGGNFIDTADVYQQGLSEEIIGNWLSKQKRSNLVIATKVRGTMGDAPNDLGLSRKHIMDGVDASLKRLQTDYIDLYQIHFWDDGSPLEETLTAMNDLVRCGKVRYVGASNVTGWQLQSIVDLCQQRGYDRWLALQQQYSLLSRESELEVFHVCKNEGIGVLPWSPLKGGLLSGKYKQSMDSLPEDSRLKWVSEKEGRKSQAAPDITAVSEKAWLVIDTVEKVAQECKKSVAQVALRWLLQKEIVSSVIIGAKTVQQLEDNMGAASEWELTPEQMERLDEVSMFDVPYPYEMVWRLNKNRQK